MPAPKYPGVPVSLSWQRTAQCRELLRRVRGSLSDMVRTSPSSPPAIMRDAVADRAIVQRLLRGDHAARDELVDQLACLPAMIRVKNRRMGNPLQPHELDDAIQNVLLAIWRKLDQYDGRVPLYHWAYGFGVIEIARTIERRTRRAERQATDDEAPVALPREPIADIERVAAALARLAEPERSIVRARHFEDATFDDIARRFGIVVNTVKTKYYRSLRQLRDMIRGMAAGQEEA